LSTRADYIDIRTSINLLNRMDDELSICIGVLYEEDLQGVYRDARRHSAASSLRIGEGGCSFMVIQ
jgi:hypothetical protein